MQGGSSAPRTSMVGCEHAIDGNGRPAPFARDWPNWPRCILERPAILYAPQSAPNRNSVGVHWTRRRTSWRAISRGAASPTHRLSSYALWNSPEHIQATIAAWKLGALVLPLRAALPARERDELLALAQPALVVSDWDGHAFPAMLPR